MRIFKWFLISVMLLAVTTTGLLIAYRGEFFRYGVKQYFLLKGMSVEVSSISLFSVNCISIEHVSFKKKDRDNHEFILVLHDVKVWISFLDLLTRGFVDRITFEDPSIQWEGLRSSLYNPFTGTFLSKEGGLQNSRGITCKNTKGILLLKGLAKQQIHFNLFSNLKNQFFGVISGNFYEDGEGIQGHIDFQSARIGFMDQMIQIDLAKEGNITGEFHLSWFPEHVSFNFVPFIYKKDHIFSSGQFYFKNSKVEEDTLKGWGDWLLGERKWNYNILNNEKELKLSGDISWSKDKNPVQYDLSFKDENEEIQFKLELNKEAFVAEGVLLKDRLKGFVKWIIPHKDPVKAEFNLYFKEDTYYFRLKKITVGDLNSPEVLMQFRLSREQFELMDLYWGHNLLKAKGFVGFKDEIPVKLDIALDHFDFSLLEPLLSQDIFHRFSGIISGDLMISGNAKELAYEANLQLKEGTLNALKFRSGGLYLKGQGLDMLISNSYFTQEHNVIFYEGETSYQGDGKFDTAIVYKTDGQAIQLAGWILEQQKDNREFLLKKRINKALSIRLRSQALATDNIGLGYNDRKTSFELEYNSPLNQDMFFLSMRGDDELMGIKRQYAF